MAYRETVTNRTLLERVWDGGRENRRIAGYWLAFSMVMFFSYLLFDNFMGECDDCFFMDPRIPYKPGIGWFIDNDLNRALLCSDLPSLDLRVTENYPPTFPAHASSGHSDGTSVDIAHNGSRIPSGDDVADVIETFESCHARAVYEVTSDVRGQELISQGVPESHLIYNSNATNEHYHVDCYRCRE